MPEITLEQTENLYRFLQGQVPDCLTLETPPALTKGQAFSVIYYLQEILHIIPDKYEKCRECGDLFDSELEGCSYLVCSGCECPHANSNYYEACNGCSLRTEGAG